MDTDRKQSNNEANDYDPHVHRQVVKPTNDFETLVHILKCSLGTGILAMPQGFARAGLVTGALGVVIAGIIVTHCLHILISSQYELCKRQRVPLLTYTDAMKSALANGPPVLRSFSAPSAAIVDAFLVVYQLGICCVYIVFIATNIKQMCDPYHKLSLEVHMFIILLPLIALNCIRNLKLLAPFSIVANILTLVGLGVVVYYITAFKKSDAPLDLWGTYYTFPLFLGTALFALTSVGVVVAVEANMKTPKSFGKPCGVLNQGMTFIVLLYVAVGALGYLFCVSQCSDSITLDLPFEPLATSVKGMMAVAIFLSYALQCFVPVEVLWRGYVQPALERRQVAPCRQLCAEYALRISICLLTFILALSIPRLGLFISLFGALCLSALAIGFPALMQLCVDYPQKTARQRTRTIKNIFLMLFGLVGLVAGTYTALQEIVRSFQVTPPPSSPTVYINSSNFL